MGQSAGQGGPEQNPGVPLMLLLLLLAVKRRLQQMRCQ